MHPKLKKFYDTSIVILAIISIIIAITDIINSVTENYAVVKIVDTLIIVIFTVDYIVRLFIASKKWLFFKENIFDLIAIIPLSNMFSIFRIARIARIVRLSKVAKATKALRLVRIVGVLGKVKRFVQTNGFIYMIYCTLFMIIVSSIIMTFVEFGNYEDSLWWVVVTLFTVGYGDISPTSRVGRIIAALLMLLGIGLVSTLTSTITSYFAQVNKEKETGMDKLINLNLNEQEINELVKYAEEKFKK